MRLSKAVKIIIGLLTAWVVITPFIFFGLWFFFVFSVGSMENSSQLNPYLNPAFFSAFFIPFLLVICTSFLQIGLQAFYLVHIILNKSGGDVLRSVLGVGVLILAVIALPVYYFIFILPENPPQWALAVRTDQPAGPGSVNNPPSTPQP